MRRSDAPTLRRSDGDRLVLIQAQGNDTSLNQIEFVRHERLTRVEPSERACPNGDTGGAANIFFFTPDQRHPLPGPRYAGYPVLTPLLQARRC